MEAIAELLTESRLAFALVAGAPTVRAVLPGFLEFAGDAVLVAHNAPYDVGFLKGACAKHGLAWPEPRVVDTARLARVALHRDEVRNCKLSTLAAHFRTHVQPTHRAFDDARATADVLHGLIERVGADLGGRLRAGRSRSSSRRTTPASATVPAIRSTPPPSCCANSTAATRRCRNSS